MSSDVFLSVLGSWGWRFLLSVEKVQFFVEKSYYKQDSQEERFVSFFVNGKRLSRLLNICQMWGDWLSLHEKVTDIDSFTRSKCKDYKDMYLHPPYTLQRPPALGTHWAQLWRSADRAHELQRTICAVQLYFLVLQLHCLAMPKCLDDVPKYWQYLDKFSAMLCWNICLF